MSVTLTSRHKNDLEIKKIFKKKIIIIYDNLCKTPQSDRAKSRVRNSPKFVNLKCQNKIHTQKHLDL